MLIKYDRKYNLAIVVAILVIIFSVGFINDLQKSVTGAFVKDTFEEPKEVNNPQPVIQNTGGGLGNIPIRVDEGPIKPLKTTEERATLFQSSTPTHGSVIGTVGEVTVTATQPIVPGSYIKLYKDNANTHVDRGYTTISGNTMTTTSLTQEPGVYVAEYHIVTATGQIEDGQFSFTVS